MSQSTKTLREILLERGGRARALDPDDVMETIRDFLKESPEGVEELAPGMVLKPKPLTRAAQIGKMHTAALETRRKQTKERYAELVPVVQGAIDANPNITLRQIAELLNDRGFKPARAAEWTPGTVSFLIKNAGIKYEPPET
jgi:hypothetical protein